MKKILTILFLLLNLETPSACFRYFVVETAPALYTFNISDPFLRAVIEFESNFQADAVNPHTGARGILQILPIMIREVNKYSDIKYTWDDAFDPVKSIEIWTKVMDVKNPEYYYDKACRIWFGTGVQWDGMQWEDYYMKIMR